MNHNRCAFAANTSLLPMSQTFSSRPVNCVLSWPATGVGLRPSNSRNNVLNVGQLFLCLMVVQCAQPIIRSLMVSSSLIFLLTFSSESNRFCGFFRSGRSCFYFRSCCRRSRVLRHGRDIDRLLDPNRPNPICVLCAPVPAPVEFKVCSICKLGRRRDRFTASQWSIGAGRQCKDCKGWFQPGVHSWSNTEDQ
jgi:hypothetical protein